MPQSITRAAVASVALAAFAVGLHKIDDFDTWWHLAAGRWIASHGAVPVTDTLSHTVRDHAWINVQWLFDLVLYGAYRAGGAVLLPILGALAFLATTALLLRLATQALGAGAGALLVLVAVLAAQERVTLRPELASFLWLALILTILDHGRRTNGRGLWALVPVMWLWANSHALFVIGVFAIACAMIGDLRMPSRALRLWGGGAIAVVLLNPYGLTGAWFPLTLLSRIDGSAAVFQTVGEFASPFAAGAAGMSLLFYKVLLALAAVTAVGVTAKTRRLDWGGLLFVAGLFALSVQTRRNIALFAVGATPVIATWAMALVPMWRSRERAWVSLGTMVAALAVTTAIVSGAVYKRDRSAQEFGVGVIDGTFPVRAVDFARAAGLPGRLYNDMGAGGYLTWDDPIGDGVFIDGRLEVYDTAFVTGYMAGVSSPTRWQAEADRRGIQTVLLFHRFENERALAGQLFTSGAWTLIYVDEVAVIFVRTAGNVDALARASTLRPDWDAKTEAWLQQPARRWPYQAGRAEALRAYARLQATVGAAQPAIEAYERLLALGLPRAQEIDTRLLLARFFVTRGRQDDAREQARRILSLDPGNVEALTWR